MNELFHPLEQPRSALDDPRPGDRVERKQGQAVRRVVGREGSRVAFVAGAGLGSVQWCELLAWQLWCDCSI